jgi:hypothetical protein
MSSSNNLSKSRAGSRAALSSHSQAGSKAGSRTNLASMKGTTGDTGGAPTSSSAAVPAGSNAIVFENTYKTKPDKK